MIIVLASVATNVFGVKGAAKIQQTQTNPDNSKMQKFLPGRNRGGII